MSAMAVKNFRPAPFKKLFTKQMPRIRNIGMFFPKLDKDFLWSHVKSNTLTPLSLHSFEKDSPFTTFV
jgi:hypothetical protein